jgi:hypothetical protein
MNAPMSKAQLRGHLDSIDAKFGAMIDGLRQEFPGMKLAYLKTDAVEIGTPTDPQKLVEMSYSPPVKPVMQAWYRDVESILAALKNKNLKNPTKSRKK